VTDHSAQTAHRAAQDARDAVELLAEVQRLWNLAAELPPAQRASLQAPIRAAAERYVAVTQSERRDTKIARGQCARGLASTPTSIR
jgi:hypothetical protein